MPRLWTAQPTVAVLDRRLHPAFDQHLSLSIPVQLDLKHYMKITPKRLKELEEEERKMEQGEDDEPIRKQA